MIVVEPRKSGAFIVSMDMSEVHAIQNLAKGFSIPVADALTAVIYRGIDNMSKQLERANLGTPLGDIDKDKRSEG